MMLKRKLSTFPLILLAISIIQAFFISKNVEAQDLIGNTLQHLLVVKSHKCNVRQNFCKDFTFNYNGNVYFGSKGTVYDFSRGNKGDAQPLGRWHNLGSSDASRWTLQNNRAFYEYKASLVYVKISFDIQGSVCTASYSSRDLGSDVSSDDTYNVEFCRIVAGRVDR